MAGAGLAEGEERRVALVIGNAHYAHASELENPVNDAKTMAAVLGRLGFDVVTGTDLDLHAVGNVQAAFEAKLRSKPKPDVALLFYAGHGLQVKGRNYLVPVGAQIEVQAHLSSRAILFNDILEPMVEEASASLIFLDACRDNPFTRKLARAIGERARSAGIRGGLARIEKVAGTFIAYATAPDTVAYDGKGDNSPFTAALLKHIETPGLSIGDMMIDVRNAVLDETQNRQEPWDQSSLRSRFYFVPQGEPPPPSPMPKIEPPPTSPMMSAAADEWAAISNTTSLAELALFKERYPNPPWSEYADIRADDLRSADRTRQETAKAEAEAEAKAKRAEAAKDQLAKASVIAEASQVTLDPGAPPQQKKPGWSARLPWALISALGGVAVIVIGLVAWQSWLRPTMVEPAADSHAPEPWSNESSSDEFSSGARPTPTAVIRIATGRGTIVRVPGDGKAFRDCRNCPEMVVVPAGRFMMGSPKGEKGHYKDEGPQHEVRIGEPFAVGRFEVTFDEWDACVADGGCNGYRPKDEGWGRGQRPVINVSWKDAKAYAAWLSRKTGKGYRLLTEAEWEYAARAGTTARYWWGDRFDSSKANNGSKTVTVGSYAANAFGVHDMHGNVWEWCEDVWHDNYNGAPRDGSAWLQGGDESRRVVRGGSWGNIPGGLRAAYRGRGSTGNRYYFQGFRLGRTLTP